MNTFSSDIGPEEEDGAGWGGLVPTKAEIQEERQRHQTEMRMMVLTAERDRARAELEFAARLLRGIHALLYPAPLKMTDGTTMVFRPENPHEFMQALSDRIRALPDEMSKAGIGGA